MTQGLRVQAAKEAAAQEALQLRQEVERVMTRHQERVASWEEAAAADEADLNQRMSALEVSTDKIHLHVTLIVLDTPVHAGVSLHCIPDGNIECSWHVQAEERRVKETARKTDERDSRSVELRSQLEADAATLQKAQKAVETERAVQKVRPWLSVACRALRLHAVERDSVPS